MITFRNLGGIIVSKTFKIEKKSHKCIETFSTYKPSWTPLWMHTKTLSSSEAGTAIHASPEYLEGIIYIPTPTCTKKVIF